MDGLLHIWNIAAAVFLVGGTLSVVVTFLLYDLYPVGLEASFARSRFLDSFLVVGIVEETAKFLVFFFMVKMGGVLRGPQDGVIYGALVGVAFGTVESIQYINLYDSWYIPLRPILNTGGHGVYGAIWGGLYSQAVYANSIGRDPGAARSAALGVPGVALLHGLWNTLAGFLPAGLAVKGVGALIAVGLYGRLVELSPYRVYPLSQAKLAVTAIRRGLVFNPKSPILNRNLGLYLVRLGKYRRASEHLKRSMQRSRDPRRARFLSAACDTILLPRFHARRELRIAWARLDDKQRELYMRQLTDLVEDRDQVLDRVNEFINAAFTPRKYKNTREIARQQKLKRIKRRHKRPGVEVTDSIETLTPEERARLARRMRGGG